MSDPAPVAVLGGGPAGLTTAFLLRRAGHPVTLYEAGPRLGGLWASRLDEQGRFLSDNSCKVFQPDYHSAPHLFRLLGLDWRDHFVQRHDLTRGWLRPFVRDCSWRDLAILGRAMVQHQLGRGRLHTRSTAAFMAEEGLSEACQRWLRATALGGIAGTLRMTMWELFHRLGSNLTETLVGPRWWVFLRHAFDLEGRTLVQRFEATGAGVGPLWRWLEPGMSQFSRLGDDLAARLLD